LIKRRLDKIGAVFVFNYDDMGKGRIVIRPFSNQMNPGSRHSFAKLHIFRDNKQNI
jgi:hypothetical protein